MAYDIFGNDIGNVPNGSQGDHGKVGPQQIEQRIGKMISENKEYLKPLYGYGAPGIPPRFIGDTYVDLTNRVMYVGYGLELPDWVTPAIVAITGNLLLEDGSGYVLTEDGYRIILEL